MEPGLIGCFSDWSSALCPCGAIIFLR